MCAVVSLTSSCSRFGHLNETIVRIYTKQILTGLAFLHAHGVVHRDVKGANILVDRSGEAKLADFGASRYLGKQGDPAAQGAQSLRGTPAFMLSRISQEPLFLSLNFYYRAPLLQAPEVIRQLGYGRKSDVWSVGCTVIEMITGKPPWSQHDNPISLMYV